MMIRAVLCGVQLPSHGHVYGSPATGGSVIVLMHGLVACEA